MSPTGDPVTLCVLCGNPMPKGEEMFQYHGHSGPCPPSVEKEQPSPREGGYCTECGYEVESFDGLKVCPGCGSAALPCAWADEVTITINWHSLRVLVMWAENWQRSKKLGRVIYAIAKRIKAQHPDRPSLTLAEELGEVAKEFPGMAVNQPDLRRDIAEQTGHEVNLVRRNKTEGDPDA